MGLALSVTAAPCQRLGCRLGRPLGNVPPGRSGPKGGSQVSPPPLGEVSCQRHDGEGNPPSGAHVHWWFAQARRSAASLACRLGRFWTVPTGDQNPRGANCPGCNPRELRAQALGRPGKAWPWATVSLAFFYALRA